MRARRRAAGSRERAHWPLRLAPRVTVLHREVRTAAVQPDDGHDMGHTAYSNQRTRARARTIQVHSRKKHKVPCHIHTANSHARGPAPAPCQLQGVATLSMSAHFVSSARSRRLWARISAVILPARICRRICSAAAANVSVAPAAHLSSRCLAPRLTRRRRRSERSTRNNRAPASSQARPGPPAAPPRRF